MASKRWVLSVLEKILGKDPTQVTDLALRVITLESQITGIQTDISGLETRVTTLENEAILVTDTEQITDETELAGQAEAAQLNLGDVRGRFDIQYDVTVAGSVIIQESTNGSDWTTSDTLESASGGEENIRTFETNHQYIRAYGDADDFNDAEINEVKLVSRGL